MFKQLSLITLVTALFISACNDDQINPTPTTTTENSDVSLSEEMATVNYLDAEMEEIVDELIGTRDPGAECAEVTFTNEPGSFPNTVIIDFGEACEGPKGHIRSGMIIVEQNLALNEPGSIRTVSFKGFSIDDVSIEGSRIKTNLSTGEGAAISFSQSNEISLTFPSGATATHSLNYVREQIEGSETDDKLDDVFQITGSAEGINRNGVLYTAVITTPLIKARTCRWISQGVVTITTGSEGENIRTIDYGYPNGECDRFALVTLPDGNEVKIRINRRWW